MIFKSNRGWQKLEFLKIKKFVFKEIDYIEFIVSCNDEFWNREKAMIGDFDDLVLDRNMTFSQVIISEKEWDEFLNKFFEWKEYNILFRFDFTPINGQQVAIELKESTKLISSKEKPVFEFTIIDNKLEFRWKMVIDNSSMI